MNDRSTTKNIFYDSDEDVSWGPYTLRELKKDLKRATKISPNYRRQTDSFVPFSADLYAINNSSYSNKNYVTGNEYLKSKHIPSTEVIHAPVSKANQTPSTDNSSSDKYLSIQHETNTSTRQDLSLTSIYSEVIEVSSDSEDDELNVEIRRFSHSRKAKFNEFTIREETSPDDIICLSSSEDEEQDHHMDKDKLCMELQDTSVGDNDPIPKIRSIQDTTLKKVNQNSSYEAVEAEISKNSISEAHIEQIYHSITQNDISVAGNQQTNLIATGGRDKSNDEVIENTPEKQLNFSTHNFCYRDHLLAHGYEKSETPKTEMQIPRINIIPSTPKKRSNNTSMNDSTSQDYSSVYNYRESKPTELSNRSGDRIEIYNESSENRNSIQSLSNDVQNTSINKHRLKSLNTSFKSVNICQNECDNHEHYCMDDTLVIMKKILTNETDSDSDSIEEIIESTPCKTSKLPFINSSLRNISKIPVLRSFIDDSKSNSSVSNEFKIPTFPTKVKKTPVGNRLIANKTSPRPRECIVSPVKLYINNSPVATLKQNNKPTCTKPQCNLDSGISENTICTRKKHRNLLDSLPEVVYKPSKLVEEKFHDQIILPKNIGKLITERIVIKHEHRKRINPDKSIYAVRDELEMEELSIIVYDDLNMSIHTTTQGYNM